MKVQSKHFATSFWVDRVNARLDFLALVISVSCFMQIIKVSILESLRSPPPFPMWFFMELIAQQLQCFKTQCIKMETWDGKLSLKLSYIRNHTNALHGPTNLDAGQRQWKQILMNQLKSLRVVSDSISSPKILLQPIWCSRVKNLIKNLLKNSMHLSRTHVQLSGKFRA